ncbi:MAG: esterase-like activity of phytase family protein [Halothece sp. Uz-M2-17]|nr:esterase-like activity of phytase family protein [Halothece sp. Uz-M2-17]
MILRAFFVLFLLMSLTACSNASQVQAQDRLFPKISVDFLDHYELPKQTFQKTPVGGLSGMTYDQKQNLFYVVSDDRSQKAPARFYTLEIDLKLEEATPNIAKVSLKDVTFLQTETGDFFPNGEIDPEGIALAPGNTVFISSEGNTNKQINPFVRRFDLNSGKEKQTLPLPPRYLLPETEENTPRGVRNNLGFESLTLNPSGVMSPEGDPFRVFTATESSLSQDQLPEDSGEQTRVRFLHYVVNPIGQPLPIAEHLYLLDQPPLGTVGNGLTEVLAIQPEGYFLTLERSYGLSGYGAKLFLMTIGNATDTSGVNTFNVDLGGLQPVRKKLLFDFSDLDFDIYNLEGLAVGPTLPDGNQSLFVISDDNFNDKEVTQILLFRLQT